MKDLSKMRELSSEEKCKIEYFVETFLNKEVFNWDLINEDIKYEGNKEWDTSDTMELKVIEYIIKDLKERISYY
jgi:hypothetical protein|tara:strand:- start:43 stop:264 length:222 start_codon:yes stop_codon:yes gene_type:complete